MSLGSSAPAGASTNQPRQGASVYTPTNQGNADIALQGIANQIIGGFGSNFSGTPGGMAYPIAQGWLGAGTDPNNVYYGQALGGAEQASGGAQDVFSSAMTLGGAIPSAFAQAQAAIDPSLLTQAIQYGAGGSMPYVEQQAGGLGGSENWIMNQLGGLIPQLTGQAVTGGQTLFGDALSQLQGGAYPQAAQASNDLFAQGLYDLQSGVVPRSTDISNQLLDSASAGMGSLFPTALTTGQGGLDEVLQQITSGIYPQASANAQDLLGNAGRGMASIFPQAMQQSGALNTAGNQILDTGMPLAVGGAADLSRYGKQILGTAFDPQGALYDQLQNQVRQQSAATAGAAGLGDTAYGASTIDNTLANFNINWQNQQLQRQATGLGAAEPAFSEAAALPGAVASSAIPSFQAATAMPGAALSSFLPSLQTGAALPGSTLQSLMTAGGQAGQLPGQTMSSFLSSLQEGAALPGQAMASALPAIQAGAALPGATLQSLSPSLTAGLSMPYQPLQQGGAIDQQIAQLTAAIGGMPASVAGPYGNLQAQAAGLPFAPLQGLSQMTGQLPGLFGGGATLSGLPYGTANTGMTSALNALSQGVNIGNQQFVLPQQIMNDLQSYLGLGQSASALSGSLGQMGQNQLMQSLSGIGGALGTGSNLLFGNSLSSSGGLLGSLGLNPFTSGLGATSQYFSPLAGTLGGVADFGGGADLAGGALAGGAGLAAAGTGAAVDAGSLASLLPLALL